ncbi:MAG: DUF3822 family protein [Saprospiraceae bacterium]|nr:DUF3822 family protein [Saprospiraceae bacterium]
MIKTPPDSIYTLLNGKKISLSRDFYFHSSDEMAHHPSLLHLGNNGKLHIHEMPNMPYKLAFVERENASETPLDRMPFIHIAELIPAISKHLPENSLTNVCLFLYENTALIFITRLKEILAVELKPYKIPDDLLYHVIHAIQKSKLVPESVHLNLAGEIATDSAIMHNFSRYFKQISVIPMSIDTL